MASRNWTSAVIKVSERACSTILQKDGPNSFQNDKFLDPSKVKEFADGNFEFDEIGRKISKRVEKTHGKEEICSLQAVSYHKVFSKELYCIYINTWVCLGKGTLMNNFGTVNLDWYRL